MYWLGVDFETTGLDVEKELITEVGAVLWDVENKAPVMIYSDLIKIDQPLTEEIVNLTGITDEMLDTFGKAAGLVFSNLSELMLRAQYIVAHNGTNFDKPLWYNEAKRKTVEFPEKPWIDTSVDVPYPDFITTRKLIHLAAEHGFVNPFAHRAVSDVLTMLRVASHYNSDTIVMYANSPNVELRAAVVYKDRELAKKCGYRWNKEKKYWLKTIKDFQLDDNRKQALEVGFRVVVQEGEKND